MPARSPSAWARAWPSTMPVSSTVWWPSTCRSPRASTVRSSRPWRARASSMWSKKPIPVFTRASPLPSRFTRTWRSVSLVLRVSSAIRGMCRSKNLLQGGDHRVHVLCRYRSRSGGTPRAAASQRRRGPGSPASSQQPAEQLLGRQAPGAHQHEVGRRRVRRQTGNQPEPGDEAVAGRDHLAGAGGQHRRVVAGPSGPRPGSSGSRCTAASPWRSPAPRPDEPAPGRSEGPPGPGPWRRSGAPPAATIRRSSGMRARVRRSPGRPRHTRTSASVSARMRSTAPSGSAEPVGLLGELSTMTRARSRSAASIRRSTSKTNPSPSGTGT